MRKFRLFFIAFMAILSVTAFFVSCGDDDDDNGNASSDASFIVGAWKYTYDRECYVLWTFYSNGTGYYYETEDGSVSDGDKFSYVCDMKKGMLIFDFENREAETVRFTKESDRTITVYDFFDDVEHWVKQ